MTPITKPFMPPSRAERASEWRTSFVNDATVAVLAKMRKCSADEVRLELRSPVSPMKREDFPGGSAITKLLLLAPDSAFTDIIGLGDDVELRGVSQLSLSSPKLVNEAGFVGEAAPIPPAQGVFDAQVVGPMRKLAMLAPVTNELENLSAPAASVVISRLLKNSVGNGGAKVLLSTDPPTDVSPGGILYGVAPLTAGASASEDIKALLADIAANAISTRSVVLIVASDLFVAFETEPWPNFRRRIIEAPTLAPGTVIALAADGFVTSGEGEPVVDVGRHATLHLADPAEQIGTPGTSPDPAVIAAPTVSMYQTDSFALRCIARVTWSVAPGCVSWIEGATW